MYCVHEPDKDGHFNSVTFEIEHRRLWDLSYGGKQACSEEKGEEVLAIEQFRRPHGMVSEPWGKLATAKAA